MTGLFLVAYKNRVRKCSIESHMEQQAVWCHGGEERTSPGLINRLCGIGYAALRKENKEYPQILMAEL